MDGITSEFLASPPRQGRGRPAGVRRLRQLDALLRDSAPSDPAEAQAVHIEAVAVVSPAVALAWAKRNKVRLPASGRAAAINAARRAAGLPGFKINVRLNDLPLPPVRSRHDGAVVLARGGRVADAGAGESGMPVALQAALLGWWRSRFSEDVAELVIVRAALCDALEPLIGTLDGAADQP